MYIDNGFYVDVIKKHKKQVPWCRYTQAIKTFKFTTFASHVDEYSLINYSLVQRITETLPNVVVREW